MGPHGIKQCTAAQPVITRAQANQAMEYLGSEGPTTKFVYGPPTPIIFVVYVYGLLIVF